MKALCVSQVKLSELLNQVLDTLRGEFLDIFKLTLENELIRLRDDLLRSKRYQRGNVLKRWGFTCRKWIETPLGLLNNVRIPRIRSYAHEVSLFCDRYVKRSGIMNALFIEMFLWGMSSRRLSIIFRKLYSNGLTASSICQLKNLLSDRVEQLRQRPIGEDIKIVVVDGIHGKYRNHGKGVCLMAIGIDYNGKAHFLDWQGCASESSRNWRHLFRRLRNRGLKQANLIVSDHAAAIEEAIVSVWGDQCHHQLCLWHFSRELGRLLQPLSSTDQRRFRRDYWELFGSMDSAEFQERWPQFIKTWSDNALKAVKRLEKHLDQLMVFYHYPASWRHRIRTVNLAEGFFSQLQVLLRRYPGWIDENHINQIVGFFILGMKVFQVNRNNFYQKGIPENILNINFNRIT